MSNTPSQKVPPSAAPSLADGGDEHNHSNSQPGGAAPPKSSAPGRKGFPKGKSGNPAGRPRGARNRATLAAEQLLDGEAEALTRKVIELAKEGDLTALRLCLERILPRRRSRTIRFSLPPLETVSALPAAYDQILGAVADGVMTIDEAQGISSLLEAKRRAIETTDLTERLERIETKVGIDP